ncbi:hypothetical protein [Tomitella gaofuii]|uniref:hypothetical protein n=1 Tax=Tomitella gaofuii TaxID=2760083 RepID=UPI0015F8B152|nr:hypothetical protein [Tomitella gaofuii]
MRFPESWTLLRATPPSQDPATGARIPNEDERFPWTGLLQQRQLTGSPVGADEFEPGHSASGYLLMLDPGLVPFPRDEDRFAGPGGVVVTVQGPPRLRKPVGSGRPAYIAAIVRHAHDVKEA